MRSVPARFLVAPAVALLLSLVAVAPAGAALTGARVTLQSPAGPLPASGVSAAGAHPDFNLVMDYDSGDANDTVKTYDIHFAPGIVSYVNHVGICTAEQFAQSDTSNASTCPADSQVGVVDTTATIDVAGIPTQVTLTGGKIYNLEPPPGSPAALAIDSPPPGSLPLLDHVKLLVTVTVDPHDLALTATIHDLPNSANGMSIHIDRIDQTLFGYVSGRSFFTNPTSCIPAPVQITSTAYSGAVTRAQDSYTPTDCGGVPFSTNLTMTADPPMSDSTSTISFDVKPGSFDVPRANSHVRGTTVVAPPGVLINPALAARLDACTDDQFKQSDTSVPANCPPSSAVGDISFVSPILGAVPGKAYFGSQTPTDRLRLFLDVPLYGAHIKVSAHVHPSYDTGQITTVFDDLPQIAFTDFALTFHGGPRSALVTPTTCGTNTATATLIPWSGGAAQTATASFVTSWDGNGAPCQRPFSPTMGTSTSSSRGGATTAFTLVANRPDRNVPIGRMTYHLPAGLVGSLALRGLVQCPLDVAAAGNCPASSRIGDVRAVAGSGTEPPSLPGELYLTKPKVAGDPAGLSVKVPAHLGPVDAGVVIVGTRLLLRPDGGLDAISDAIPAFQLGIPLAMRQLTVTVNRDGFMRNPTSCGTKTAAGHFDSIGNEHADASSTLHFTDCDKLHFGPRFAAYIGARHATGVGNHPPFTTVIATRGDDATIRSAHVRLPLGLASNTRSLNAACATDAFAAGRCPARSQVGTATALSPLLRDPVRGPVYLVKRPPGQFGLPRLVVQFRTPIQLTLEATINIGSNGAIGTTFPVVPDLPMTRFTLRFHGGAYGPIALTRNICRAHKLRLPGRFTGANGRTVGLRPRIVVRGCVRHKAHRHRTRKR